MDGCDGCKRTRMHGPALKVSMLEPHETDRGKNAPRSSSHVAARTYSVIVLGAFCRESSHFQGHIQTSNCCSQRPNQLTLTSIYSIPSVSCRSGHQKLHIFVILQLNFPVQHHHLPAQVSQSQDGSRQRYVLPPSHRSRANAPSASPARTYNTILTHNPPSSRKVSLVRRV